MGEFVPIATRAKERRNILMKTKFAILMVLTLTLVQSCSSGIYNETASPATEPIVSTAIAGSDIATLPPPASDATETIPPGGNPISEGGITLDDNGKTFTMHVGDSVLLNLGTDAYDWTVAVENETVVHMKMGVMVIKGAQGIYDALTPGTATLSASGNPLCLQSRPACALPSILFTVTIVVE